MNEDINALNELACAVARQADTITKLRATLDTFMSRTLLFYRWVNANASATDQDTQHQLDIMSAAFNEPERVMALTAPKPTEAQP